jgi:DNA-binding transcriptional ArsR family regulator
MKQLGGATTTAADVMKALSDPTRWEIIRQMAETDELPCAALESTLPLSKPTISYHTNILLKAGLIKARKAGRNFFYSLNREAIDELMNELWALAPQPRPVRQGRVNHGSSPRRRRGGGDSESAPQKPAEGDAPLLTW